MRLQVTGVHKAFAAGRAFVTHVSVVSPHVRVVCHEVPELFPAQCAPIRLFVGVHPRVRGQLRLGHESLAADVTAVKLPDGAGSQQIADWILLCGGPTPGKKCPTGK